MSFYTHTLRIIICINMYKNSLTASCFTKFNNFNTWHDLRKKKNKNIMYYLIILY